MKKKSNENLKIVNLDFLNDNNKIKNINEYFDDDSEKLKVIFQQEIKIKIILKID